jgi:hypothetical protein
MMVKDTDLILADQSQSAYGRVHFIKALAREAPRRPCIPLDTCTIRRDDRAVPAGLFRHRMSRR